MRFPIPSVPDLHDAALAALRRYGYAGPVLLVNNDAQVQPGMRLALEARLTHTNTPMLIAPRLMQDGQEQGWLYYQPTKYLLERHYLHPRTRLEKAKP